jgi:hypothetical protein
VRREQENRLRTFWTVLRNVKLVVRNRASSSGEEGKTPGVRRSIVKEVQGFENDDCEAAGVSGRGPDRAKS